MMRRFLILLGFALLGMPHSHAQETARWKTVGEWQISVDKSLNYGCFMYAGYVRGTVIRIGFDQDAQGGYIIIGNSAWRSLEVGKEYLLIFKFDDEAPWRGRATGKTIGTNSPVFLYAPFDKPNFMVDFGRKQSLSIWYGEQFVTTLTLRGSYAALQELASCQKVIEEARGAYRPSDPFAVGSQRPVSDPFRR